MKKICGAKSGKHICNDKPGHNGNHVAKIGRNHYTFWPNAEQENPSHIGRGKGGRGMEILLLGVVVGSVITSIIYTIIWLWKLK